MSARLEIPMPRRIANLDKDVRGYPIPYVAQRWKSLLVPPPVTKYGLVAVNDPSHGRELVLGKMDEERQRRCMLEGKCSVCGTRIKGNRWMAGGLPDDNAERAMVGEGIDGGIYAFREPWVDTECMRYALHVCPGLVVGRRSQNLRVVMAHQWEFIHERLFVTLSSKGVPVQVMHKIHEDELTEVVKATSVLFYIMCHVTAGEVYTPEEFFAMTEPA
jgi:hypothetical protein